MDSANGVSGDKGGPPPPPSPLTGCYLLIVVGEPFNEQHKDIVLQRIAKGLLSWDLNECLVDLEKELAIITEQALDGEEARYGERLIQFASENLVTEILIHPAVSTLAQCMRNLLSSFTRHRHIIHAGYTFAANGSWALQDGTFSYVDFSEAFQELEVQRVVRAYENGITMDIHCAQEGDWIRLPKEQFAKACKVRINPTDVLTSGSPAITGFVQYLAPFLVPTALENLLESSDVVGNIRFSRPTLYVFPGGQGDAALFGINGFNMLLDGGYSRKACFWDFVRHLDRLDAVLMTRLNNSNVGGISSVLRRKKQDALYPQIGHFFCNMQERKSILSPDGDKDKDPLLINLLDEGQEIISNLRHLNLNPQVCYRDSEPINLYHKVGHGTLDMYVLSPAKDSKEVREFLIKWNHSDQKLFANAKSSREFSFPIQNLISISALLVWRPANANDTITRILYPGSCPQNKILEGLDRLKNLEFIKHSTCTEKSLAPISTTKKTAKEAIFDKIILKERPPTEKKENKLIENDLPPVNGDVKEKDKVVKKSDSTESDRSTKAKKPEEPKIIENGDKPKPKSKAQKPRGESQQRRKPVEKKSPTFSKKTVENGDIKKPKQSPITTPAKSAKDATNRKVIENKTKKDVSKAQLPNETKPKPEKVERKPISRRPPVKKTPISPAKKIVNGIQKPDSISKKGKLDKEGTTDSSTVSTPSADQESVLKKDISKLTPEELHQMKAQELAELKEEQEAIKEIEAVFRKGEGSKVVDEALRKVKDISIEDKLEPEEYLIIEKEVIEQVSIEEKETKDENQKLARDSEESEKQRKASTEEQEKVQEQLNEIEETPKQPEEPNATSKVTSPDEKVDVSTDKKITDKEGDEEIKDVAESQPEEKVSANIKSGDTTTAPTLPEDERIPLDEIKEDLGPIEEKHVKEDTKEKEIPAIHVPPKTFENVTKLPAVVGIRLDKQQHIRDIVKTPDEVADLPVHEEVDYEYTQELKVETPKSNEIIEKKDDQEKEAGVSKEDLKEEAEKDLDEVLVRKSSVMQDELKTLTDTVLKNELEKDILKDYDETTKTKLDSTETKKEEKDVEQAPSTRKKRSLDLNETEVIENGEIKKIKDDSKEEVKEDIKEKVKEEVKADTKEDVNEVVKEETKEEVKEEVKADSKEEIKEEVKGDTKEEVKEEVKVDSKEEIKEEAKEDTKEEVKDEVKIDSKDEVKIDSKDEVKMDSKDEVKVDSKDEVNIDSKDEVKIDSKEEVKEEVKEDTKEAVKEEFKTAKDEIKEEVKEETKAEIKEEVKEKTKDEVTEETKEEVKEEVMADSKEEVKEVVKEDSKKEFKEEEMKETEEVKLETDGVKEETKVEIMKVKEQSQVSTEEVTKVINKEEIFVSKETDEIIIKEGSPSKEVSEKLNEKILQEEEEIKVEIQIDSPTKEISKAESKIKDDPAVSKDNDQISINEKETKIEDVGIKEIINEGTKVINEISKEIETKESESTEQEKTEVVTTIDDLHDELRTKISEKTKHDRQETVDQMQKIDDKLQNLRDALIEHDVRVVEIKEEKINDDIEKVADILSDVDKFELGRKSPKEREEDVMKIVAGVAEVLKSEVPLEKFEAKIPITTSFSTYTAPYPTELRETHITTIDSPTIEMKVINTDIPPIPEEPHYITASFLEEERKIAPVHEADSTKLEEKRNSLLKESQELMMATSKMLSDIKSGKTEPQQEPEEYKDDVEKPEDESTEDEKADGDAGVVHRMLVTASSEDGGEEIEICPAGTITFSKSSESSGRSSPDPSNKALSQKSSIVDTISDTLSTVRQVAEIHSEKDSGIDDADQDKDEKDSIKEEKISGKSTPDIDATTKSLASGKSTPDISEKSKEIPSIDEAKKDKVDEEKEGAGILDRIGQKIEDTLTSVEELIHSHKDDETEKRKESLVKEPPPKVEKVFEETSYSISAVTTEPKDLSKGLTEDLSEAKLEDLAHPFEEYLSNIENDFKEMKADITTNNIAKYTIDIDKSKDSLIKEVHEAELELKDIQRTVKEQLAEKSETVSKDVKEQIEEVKEGIKDLKDDIACKVVAESTINNVIEDIKDSVSKGIKDSTIQDNVSDITKTIEDKQEKLKTTIDESKKDIIEKAEEAKVDLTKEQTSIFEAINIKEEAIKPAVHGSLKDGLDTVKDVNIALSQDVKDILQKTEEFKDKIEDKKEELNDAITEKEDELTIKKNGILGGINNLKDDILGTVKDLGSTFQEQVEEKSDKLTETKEYLVEDLKIAKESLVDKKEELESATREVVKETVDDLKQKTDEIKGNIKDIKDEVKSELSDSVDNLLQKKDEVKDEAESLAHEISESVTTTKESVLQTAKNTKESIEAGVSFTIDEKVEDLSSKAKDIKHDILDKRAKIESDLHSAVDKKSDELVSTKIEIKDETEGIKDDILCKIGKVEADIHFAIEQKVDDISKKEETKEALKDIIDTVEGTKEIIKSAASTPSEELEVLKIFEDVQDKKKQIKTDLHESIKAAITDINDDTIKSAADVKDQIFDKKENLEKAAKDLIEDIRDTKQIETDLYDKLTDKKQEIETDVIDSLESAKGDISDKKVNLEGHVHDIIHEEVDDVKDLVDDVHGKKQLIETQLQDDVKDTRDTLKEAKETLKDAKDHLKDAKDTLKDAKDTMSEIKTEKLEGIKDTKDMLDQKEKLEDDVKEKVVEIKDFAKELEESVEEKKDKVKTISKDIKDNIVEQVDELTNRIHDTVDEKIDGLKEIKEDILKQADIAKKSASDETCKVVDASKQTVKEIQEDIDRKKDETIDVISATKDSLENDIKDLIANQKTTFESVDETFDKTKTEVLQSAKSIKDEFVDTKEKFETTAIQKLDDLTTKKDEKLGEVKQDVEEIIKEVKDIKTGILDKGEEIESIVAQQADILSKKKDAILEDVKDKKQNFQTTIQDTVAEKIDDFTKGKEELLSKVSDTEDAFKKDIHEAVSSLSKKTDQVNEALEDTTKETKNKMIEEKEKLEDKLEDVSKTKEQIIENLKDIKSTVTEEASETCNVVLDEADAAKKIFTQTKDTLKTEASNVVDKAGKDVQDTVTSIKDEAISIINNIGLTLSKTEPTTSIADEKVVKDEKSPSEIETMDEKMAKNEAILEDAANDLEDTFDNIVNMTQSVIFNKCDEAQKENKTLEEDKPKSTKDLEETFELVGDISKCETQVKRKSADFGESSAEKFDEFEKGEKETMEKSKKEDSNQPKCQITPPEKNEQKTVELCDKDTSKQDNLLHEKQFPGRTTPPTAPVSPNITDEVKFTSTTDTGVVEAEISSDFTSQIFSSQVLDRDSDDEEEQYSITSQVAHSRDSSHGDFDLLRNQDPMSMSLYGGLPDEEDDLPNQKTDSKNKEETSAAQGSSSADQEKKDPIETWGKPLELPGPTCLYETTKAKCSTPGLRNEDQSDEDLEHSFKASQATDLMTASFYGDLPTAENDPIQSWGKPLGLPSPAAPNDNKGTPKKEKKLPATVTAKNKLNDDKKRAESPSKYNKNKKVNPVYVDLTYVPHHGNTYYAYVDFFRRVRARYYVFSGIEPSREVYNALLEAKQTWEDKELEVTIIPTYDTDILGYWVAENEELLTKYKIDLSPSASRCTINLQDHETSCSAYRLEF